MRDGGLDGCEYAAESIDVAVRRRERESQRKILTEAVRTVVADESDGCGYAAMSARGWVQLRAVVNERVNGYVMPIECRMCGTASNALLVD
jgi:hypothetical protein